MGVKRRQRVWHAKPLHFLLTMLILSACSVAAPPPRKIALLAPFEGQYRDIGYEALYGAQMTLKSNNENLNSDAFSILPLDDGGTENSARERANALKYDPSIVAVLAVGPYSTAESVQVVYGDLPVLLVGYWPSIPQRKTIAAMAHDFRNVLPTVPDPYAKHEESLVGGEILSLEQFDQLEDCTIWSSGTLPNDFFKSTYESMNVFAPSPRLISELTYYSAFVILSMFQMDVPLRDAEFLGLEFNEAGYLKEGTGHKYSCESIR